ncbi:MAG: DUF4249 domain-containing protein [Bacteroidales bacterium]|nr:DUF4249 domain-containing protein [Bacteroidales bacterium]
MKVNKIQEFFLLVIIIITSCRELYFPDDIRSLEQTPVIRGIICEGSSPAVSITYAMGYYENTEILVSNATVVITDNLGNQVELLEESAGSYKPASDDYIGVIGGVYTLHVTTHDGIEYESDPVTINERPVIDSIYARLGELEAILYNQDGEPYTDKIHDGFYLFTDLSAETNSTVYYRFNTSVIRLFSYLIQPPMAQQASNIYIWERPDVIDDFYSVAFITANNGRQILPGHEIGYLQWIDNPPCYAITSSTAPWVLILKVYAISSGVYDYYHSIDQQLNADNQMFAPVPSQIKTNIHCINDPARTISGVFEASSMAVSYKAFLFINKNILRSKNLETFPDYLESGSQSVDPPDFWVGF